MWWKSDLLFHRIWKNTIWFFLLFCITGPQLPYAVDDSAMAKSPDGRGVFLFGGKMSGNSGDSDRILELRAGANSWNILNITLKNIRREHIVIPLQWSTYSNIYYTIIA